MAEYDIPAGQYKVAHARFAVIAARFNHEITDRLLAGAIDTLAAHQVTPDVVTVVRVPGAFEIPLVAARLARRGDSANAARSTPVDAVITLGAIVRGDTPHFDFVATECARGVGRVALDCDCPVIFGVLTTDTMEQALARAGGSAGNKGSEAAHAALEMVTVLRELERA